MIVFDYEIIILAIIIDLIIGDPFWLYHPVRLIGLAIENLKSFFYIFFKKNLKLAGVLINLVIVLGTYLICYFLIQAMFSLHNLAGLIVEIILIYSTLAIKSLAREGWVAAKLIRQGKIEKARIRIQNIVSRDLSKESNRGLIRSVIETLTENISDGIIAPLFFAIIGGAPLAMAYKAINTLDSMIGYKDEDLKDFGWFSAKIDDIVNYIPARITGILMILTSFLTFRSPIQSVKCWVRDAKKGPSPNGGIPIVVFAGALNITLGGDCSDKNGNRIKIPVVGGNRVKLQVNDIYWAVIYIYSVTILFLMIYLTIIWLTGISFQ